MNEIKKYLYYCPLIMFLIFSFFLHHVIKSTSAGIDFLWVFCLFILIFPLIYITYYYWNKASLLKKILNKKLSFHVILPQKNIYYNYENLSYKESTDIVDTFLRCKINGLDYYIYMNTSLLGQTIFLTSDQLVDLINQNKIKIEAPTQPSLVKLLISK